MKLRVFQPSLPEGITKKQSHFAQKLADNEEAMEGFGLPLPLLYTA